jgi:hypothetical protein
VAKVPAFLGGVWSFGALVVVGWCPLRGRVTSCSEACLVVCASVLCVGV